MGEGKAKKEAPRRRLNEGACVHMAVVQERSLGFARDDGTWGADRFTRVVCHLFRRGYSRIAAFPSRGRCPAGSDRVTMV